MIEKIQVSDLPQLQQAWAITLGKGWWDYVWVNKDGSKIYLRQPKKYKE